MEKEARYPFREMSASRREIRVLLSTHLDLPFKIKDISQDLSFFQSHQRSLLSQFRSRPRLKVLWSVRS